MSFAMQSDALWRGAQLATLCELRSLTRLFHSKHFHHLVPEVVNDFDRDPAALGLGVHRRLLILGILSSVAFDLDNQMQ
jgi:hypothetical protein